jgi:hypothetical protein
MIDQIKARVTAGEAASRVTEELINRHGRSIGMGSQPKYVSCVGVIRNLAEKDEITLRKVFPLVHAMVGSENKIVGHHLNGLFYLESWLNRNGQTLTEPRWRKKLEELPLSVFEERYSFYRKAVQSNGSARKLFAMAVTDVLNKNTRNRLKYSLSAATSNDGSESD